MNIVFWGLIIGVPLAIGGALAVFSKDLALRAFERFAASRRGAWFLTAIAGYGPLMSAILSGLTSSI